MPDQRLQIRVGSRKIDYLWNEETKTWRVRKPGLPRANVNYITGEADDVNAATDAVRAAVEEHLRHDG